MLESIRRPWATLALLSILAAVLLSSSSSTATRYELYNHVQGKNNTALFLVNSNYGYSNVHLATAHALMERHPEVKLHFASHTRMGPRLERVETAGRAANPAAQSVPLHLLPAVDYEVALRNSVDGWDGDDIMIPPGLPSISYQAENMWRIFAPWEPEDHLAIYRRCRELIDEIDPAVVVLDPMFKPGVEAVRDAKRLHSVVSPITFEFFIPRQPWLKGLWKYPAVGTGFGYPLTWGKLFVNMYAGFRYMYAALRATHAEETRRFLRDGGIQEPLDFLRHHLEDAPWLTQAMRGASCPIEHLPANLTLVGPIVLSLASAEEQDAEIARWMEKAPTVLINLGSIFKYSEERAGIMVEALKTTLERTDIQVLWKLQKVGDYGDEFMEDIKGYITEGRVRIEKWLNVDPAALVHSGSVVASVNHGGANIYHEALSAGIPQVILPGWLDTYDYAAMSEYGGFGVWASKDTTPDWTIEGLTAAFLKVLDGGEEGSAMRERAHVLGEEARERPGRETAARIIAELAASGRA